jgi:hypothetical protein
MRSGESCVNRSEDRPPTRREALQWSLGALGAGLILGAGSQGLTSTPEPAHPERRAARGVFFGAEELALLGEVAEIMIPATDTPGARAANVHGFLDHLMAEWALPQTQAQMRALLGEIDVVAKARFGVRFLSLEPEQKFQLISALDAAAFAPEPPAPGQIQRTHAFARFKGLIFLGYYHSEIGATQELQFQLVPGRYEPCVALSEIGKARVENDIWESLGYQQLLTP